MTYTYTHGLTCPWSCVASPACSFGVFNAGMWVKSLDGEAELSLWLSVCLCWCGRVCGGFLLISWSLKARRLPQLNSVSITISGSPGPESLLVCLTELTVGQADIASQLGGLHAHVKSWYSVEEIAFKFFTFLDVDLDVDWLDLKYNCCKLEKENVAVQLNKISIVRRLHDLWLPLTTQKYVF